MNDLPQPPGRFERAVVFCTSVLSMHRDLVLARLKILRLGPSLVWVIEGTGDCQTALPRTQTVQVQTHPTGSLALPGHFYGALAFGCLPDA
jgi:hypothetical protein